MDMMQIAAPSTQDIRFDFVDSIICKDAADGLSELPPEIADAIVTSPPYYSQRDYSHPLQIGNEETPDAYIDRLIAVFRECHRVLRPQGTVWLNVGDKYE